MSSAQILVLASLAVLGSFVLQSSAFAQLPPPGPAMGGPPPGGPPPGGPPPGGPPGGALPHGGPPGGGMPNAGPPGGGNLGGRIAGGNVGSIRGVSGGARFYGNNTYNSGVYRGASNYGSGSGYGYGYGYRGGYRYYGAAAAGAAAGYAYGRSTSGDQSSCYETVRYQTRSGWRTRRVYVCD